MELLIENLTKKFNQQVAVNNVSFQLKSGQCIALLGANGAGKTTTLRMLAGLLTPTSGEIKFDGSQNGVDIRSKIGYLPQHPAFYGWMTGKEFLVYVGRLANLTKLEAENRADHLLEQVGISDAKNKRIGKYSGGMRQRLGIAQALIHKPSMIMLDEPVSALDPIGRREVLTLLQELKQDTTILFSTHILNDAEEISDGLLLIHQGQLVEQGSLAELREKYQKQKIELSFKEVDDQMIEQLNQLSSIVEISQNRDQLNCIVNNVDLAREQILSKTLDSGWQMTNFTVSRATLEDMFMEVVNK
ncbi:ABC transporter ATP-binding protein [Amphibacillus xylanus]|uniref:Putative ABC transporter ATP-binding protein n=1 Tax=Amphibacillus xylanus (strain ATCC 51415 / DSM 6626 / JCM 7361 / LMG 17667 / NBRC 15112 / Ep01) TaxID=698758 RepID=K0IWM1_AMPXN|nr:ABC transporter ATP-binding protein [Amphibacillus xylanus]BAM46749.1 putative ABC transporter ATP-binding protein [Amphibacillus xylanus NBRC 15112]